MAVLLATVIEKMGGVQEAITSAFGWQVSLHQFQNVTLLLLLYLWGSPFWARCVRM